MSKTTHDEIQIGPDEAASTAALKMIANAATRRASELSTGRAHVPEFHADGWKIAFETPRGPVGLWSCWLGNQFHLGYPGPAASAQVDDLIVHHLGVQPADPVAHVAGTAVSEHYEGEYRDLDKPVEVNGLGQFVAYQSCEATKWATHFGPRVVGRPGRVWIDHSSQSSSAVDFRMIAPGHQDGYSVVPYGQGDGWNISTFPYTFANRHAPDGPTAIPEHVQPYRDKFLALACSLAGRLGGARSNPRRLRVRPDTGAAGAARVRGRDVGPRVAQRVPWLEEGGRPREPSPARRSSRPRARPAGERQPDGAVGHDPARAHRRGAGRWHASRAPDLLSLSSQSQTPQTLQASIADEERR